MAHEVSEKVIERIKKLLALANNNPNEAEAEAAMAKAQAMLEQHNLDVASIGHTAQGRPRKDQKQKGGLYGWQRKLWENVAKLNFCHYWSLKGLKRGSTYEHRIVGSHANVVSTELMAEYLQNAIERMAQTWAKEQGYKSVFVREAIAYREGLAERIALRLSLLREQRIAEAKQKAAEEAARAQHPAYASSGTALTIVDIMEDEDALNNDYLQGWEPGTTAAMRAAQKARQAAWVAEQAEKQRIHEEKLQNDPAYKADYEAKQAEIEAANQKWYEDYLKKQARRESRSSGRQRTRALTPEEQRAQMREFRQGYNDGDKIGLDTQVDGEKRRAVK